MEFRPAPRIFQKPASVKNWLARLNWVIVSWVINVGDPVEYALDIVITWVNVTWDLASWAHTKIDSVATTVANRVTFLETVIESVAIKLSNRIDGIPYYLEVWWGRKKADIIDLIPQIPATTTTELDNLRQGLAYLSTQWNKLILGTFPTWKQSLIDLRSEWMGFKTNILPMFVTKSYMNTAIAIAIHAFRDEIGIHSSWIDAFKEFISNPIEWFITHVLEPIFDEFDRGMERGLKGGKK